LVVALPASDRQGFDEQQPAVMRVPRGLARLKHFSAGFRWRWAPRWPQCATGCVD